MTHDLLPTLTDEEVRRSGPDDDASFGALATPRGVLPLKAMEMQTRIDAYRSLPDHVVFVACTTDPERTVGWVDVSIVHHLQNEPYGEIGGLVVASDCRGLRLARPLGWLGGDRADIKLF